MSREVDLVWERPVVEAYEASIIEPPTSFWTEMLQLVGLRKTKGSNDAGTEANEVEGPARQRS